MPSQVLTDKQRSLLLGRAEDTDSWRNEDDLARRREVAAEFQKLVHNSGISHGKSLNSQQLCELIGLQWQIQNLNPMSMPKFLGSYAYKVHFGSFTGSKEDLVAERELKTGSASLYDGADLAEVSAAVQQMASDNIADHAAGASRLLGVSGAGQAIVSGFLHLLHADRYGLVNAPTKAPFFKGGWLGVTDAQRTEAQAIAESSLSNAKQLTKQSFKLLFRWQVFLGEALELCKFTDYHELDQFLWTAAVDLPPTDADERIAAAVSAINDPSVLNRRHAEAEAKQLIENNLGNLSAEQLRQLFTLINTSLGKKGVVFTRFGLAFTGHNANLLIDQKDALNRAIADLWKAPHEDVPTLLNKFWQERFSGGGRSLPTAILYLRDPEKYAVWTANLEKALYSVLPGLPAKIRSGFSYGQYCQGVQRLRQKAQIPVEMHDFVLFKLATMKAPSTPPGNGEFAGFSADAFQFLSDLAEHNNAAWFEDNRTRFTNSVDAPLRALVHDLGEQIVTPLDPNLETSAKSDKCIARIRKRPTDEPYHTHYWAAFYRRNRKKPEDAQLFITLTGEGLQHGFYIGDQAADVREQLVKNVAGHPEIAKSVFEKLRSAQFIFASCTGPQGAPDPVPVDDFQGFEKLLSAGQFQIYRQLSPAEATAAGPNLKQSIGKDLQTLHPLFRLATVGDPTKAKPPIVGADEPPVASISVADLVAKTFLEEEFFQRLDKYLLDKRQLIFCGPPGTGKTHVAIEYAKYLAQGDEVDTVQFHPSYGYEDFIEGLRPKPSHNGGLTYEIADGVFKRLCDKARVDPDRKYVLVVDEINRGNIPRIFGELLFLLERRDQKTILPYSQERFSVPGNVIILGTMNSSDRSIALMDLALRRRFHFVDMQPRGEILLAWLKANKKSAAIHGVFEQLNAKLRAAGIEQDRLIGHAHFMSASVDEDDLELVWSGTIQPLLREYFFAEPERLEEFQWELFGEAAVEALDEDEEIAETMEAEET